MGTKDLFIGVLVAAIVMVMILLGTQTWNPSWNPFVSAPPAEMLKQGLDKLFALKSLAVQGAVELASQETGKDFDLSLNFQLEIDKQDSENKKSQGNFGLGLMSKEMTFDLAGEVKSFKDEFYLKLTTLPEIIAMFVSPSLVEAVQGQWLKIDKASLENLSGQQILPEEQDKAKEEILKREIERLFLESEIFRVKEQLPDEEIGGGLAEHYLIALDKPALKELIPEVLQVLLRYSEEVGQEQAKQGLDDLLRDFPQQFDKVSEQIGEIEFEVWLAETNQLPLKIKFSKEIDLAKLAELQVQPEEEKEVLKGKMVLALDLKFSKFDEPLTIEPPTDFTPFQELFGSLIPGALETP